VVTDIHPSGSFMAGFVSSNGIKPGLVLVTGPRGSGKTSWCMRLVERARAFGLRPGGLISPAVFESGQKTGINLLEFTTGECRRLAYRRGNVAGDLWTSDWQLVAETLKWGNSVLERLTTCDLFILDEAGPLEFDHGVGLVKGLEIIASRKNIPSFITVRPSLLPIARLRWPWAQVLDVSTEAGS
jgi:nucleoside-triphosphatase THEP1